MNRQARGIGVIGFGLFVAIGTAQARAPDEFPPLSGEASRAIQDDEDAGRELSAPVEPLLSVQYANLWVKDTVDVVTAPVRFDGHDWRKAGYLGLGLVATVAVLDRPVRDLVQRNRSDGVDRFLKDVEPFGASRYTLPLIGGFYAYGLAADDRGARATAQDMLITSLGTEGTGVISSS